MAPRRTTGSKLALLPPSDSSPGIQSPYLFGNRSPFLDFATPREPTSEEKLDLMENVLTRATANANEQHPAVFFGLIESGVQRSVREGRVAVFDRLASDQRTAMAHNRINVEHAQLGLAQAHRNSFYRGEHQELKLGEARRQAGVQAANDDLGLDERRHALVVTKKTHELAVHRERVQIDAEAHVKKAAADAESYERRARVDTELEPQRIENRAKAELLRLATAQKEMEIETERAARKAQITADNAQRQSQLDHQKSLQKVDQEALRKQKDLDAEPARIRNRDLQREADTKEALRQEQLRREKQATEAAQKLAQAKIDEEKEATGRRNSVHNRIIRQEYFDRYAERYPKALALAKQQLAQEHRARMEYLKDRNIVEVNVRCLTCALPEDTKGVIFLHDPITDIFDRISRVFRRKGRDVHPDERHSHTANEKILLTPDNPDLHRILIAHTTVLSGTQFLYFNGALVRRKGNAQAPCDHDFENLPELETPQERAEKILIKILGRPEQFEMK